METLTQPDRTALTTHRLPPEVSLSKVLSRHVISLTAAAMLYTPSCADQHIVHGK